MFHFRQVLLAALTAILVFGAPARAQDKDAEAARAAYNKAVTAYNLGHFADALARFEQAYELKPVPALLFNIAQCHRQLNDLKAAARVYHSFIRDDPQNPQVGKAKELLAQVEDALQRQTSAREAPPLELAAQQPEARVAAPAGAVRKAPQPTPVEAQANAPRRWPAVVAGALAVALAGGGAFEAMASKSSSDDLATLHAGTYTAQQDLQLRNDAKSAYSRSHLLYGAAAAAAALSVTFFFVF